MTFPICAVLNCHFDISWISVAEYCMSDREEYNHFCDKTMLRVSASRTRVSWPLHRPQERQDMSNTLWAIYVTNRGPRGV